MFADFLKVSIVKLDAEVVLHDPSTSLSILSIEEKLSCRLKYPIFYNGVNIEG